MSTDKRVKLWVFDFDGTLAPLVPERDRAKLHPTSFSLLHDLKGIPGQRVAILSSRHLDDLIPRIPLSNIFLGGSSGVEWQFPDGSRVIFGDRQRLRKVRDDLLHGLRDIASLPGIELEDKQWSVALHTRNANSEEKHKLLTRIENWRATCRVEMFKGPEVIDIQLIPGIDKTFGMRTFCRFLRFDPSECEIVYAGDDTNDARAMRWVDQNGGATITVGDYPLIPGSRVVCDQIALANEIREIAGLLPNNCKHKEISG